MAVLPILEFPDARLRTVAAPVTAVSDQTRQLIDDMFETMRAANGIGLAATQVDVHQRIIVMDLGEETPTPRVFINPEIEVVAEQTQPYDEGCLSVPGFYAPVERPSEVIIRALDRDGRPFEERAQGLLAVCIQHEIDHLDGKLFVDYLSPLKRQRIRKKLEKQQRL
ncbi:peptide deformylase [Gammaproteobacteria bacterium LSUCC0057]|uniref:Peptide deformylase n=1 Tax=Gammaproteobacteria bacterium LSUCC0057 TaxID=2559237 RepID=A0A4Y8UGX0_9GAMM|nr:peptide deformylase [Gammaproteobacteria bacterium LSUCC0057]